MKTAKPALHITTLKSLLSDLNYASKQVKVQGDSLSIVHRALKKREEFIDICTESGRRDLIDAAKNEVELISTYLPPQLDSGELLNIAKTVAEKLIEDGGVKALTIKDMGKFMRAMKKAVGTGAPPASISEAVKKVLDGKNE